MKGIPQGRYMKEFCETSTVSPPRPITFSPKSEAMGHFPTNQYLFNFQELGFERSQFISLKYMCKVLIYRYTMQLMTVIQEAYLMK